MDSPGSTRKEWDGEALEAHPAANLFPLMDDEEFERLLADIRANGFRPEFPVVLYRGLVLDGRNRLNVCRVLKERGELTPKSEPVFRRFDEEREGCPIAYVGSANLPHRSLDKGQKAMIGKRLTSLPEKQAAQERMRAGKKIEADPAQLIEQGAPKGRVAERATRAYGVNRQYIYDAQKIDAADAALGDAVVAGKLKIPEAKKALAFKEAAPKQYERVKAGLALKQVLKEGSARLKAAGRAPSRLIGVTDADLDQAIVPTALSVRPGDWWQLGEHRLICGDSSSEAFVSRATEAGAVFAFADPPYNAGVAEWDHGFLFLGSGTTLIAATQLGRRCLGAERDPIFCARIIALWETVTGEKAVRLCPAASPFELAAA